MISSEHIRYAKNKQLARLLDLRPSVVACWVRSRGYRTASLAGGNAKGIPTDLLVAGCNLSFESRSCGITWDYAISSGMID